MIRLWYVSFANDEGFLGGVFTEAGTSEGAYFKVTLKKLNPGGEVLIIPVQAEEAWRIEGVLDRLLTREEILSIDSKTPPDNNFTDNNPSVTK
jgi:hypothetical protein